MREVEGVAHEEEVGQHDGEVDAVHGEANERDAVHRLVQEGPVQQGNKERADQHQRLQRDGDEPWRGLADAVGHLGVARWPCRSSTDGEPQVEELQDECPVREVLARVRLRAEGGRCGVWRAGRAGSEAEGGG